MNATQNTTSIICPLHGDLETKELLVLTRFDCPCGYSLLYRGGTLKVKDPHEAWNNFYSSLLGFYSQS